MGFNIIKDGQVIGWTASKYADDSVTFIDDTLDIKQDIDTLKANKISSIKQQAAQMIAATDWRLQRATERDSIGVKGVDVETPLHVYNCREAIRRASNRAETDINALTEIVAIDNYELVVGVDDHPESKVATNLQFLKRFSDTERVQVIALSKDNPSIGSYLKMLEVSKFVTLTDDDVIGGIHALEQAGIIDAGRAAEILAID